MLEANKTTIVNKVIGLFYQVVAASQIKDPISIQDFLSPVNEAASELGMRMIEEIIKEHLNLEQNDDKEIHQPPPPPPTTKEVDIALKLVREYLIR